MKKIYYRFNFHQKLGSKHITMDSKYNKTGANRQGNYKKLFDKEVQRRHEDELGLNIPEGYFSKSKQDILTKVSLETAPQKHVFFFKKRMVWYAAASVLLLITMILGRPNKTLQVEGIQTIVLDTIETFKDNKIETGNIEPAEHDILITSLFIEDHEVDDFIDDYVLDEALIDEAL